MNVLDMLTRYDPAGALRRLLVIALCNLAGPWVD